MYDLSHDAASGPEIDGRHVRFLSEKQLGRSVARRAHVCDFPIHSFRSWVVRGPCDAEVGEVCGAGGGGEEDVGGFDVAVDHTYGVEMCQGCEEVVDYLFCFGGGWGCWVAE